MMSSAKSAASGSVPTGAAARTRALEAGPAAVDALAPAGLSRASARRRRIFERPVWTALCVGLDVVLMALGNVAALVGAPAARADVRDAELIWLFPVLVVGLLALRGGYRDRIDVRAIDGVARIVAATSLAAISLIAAAALLDPQADPASVISRAWLFATVYVAGGHVLLAWARKRARSSRLIAEPTLIVGAGHVGAGCPCWARPTTFPASRQSPVHVTWCSASPRRRTTASSRWFASARRTGSRSRSYPVCSRA
jgi:hypothetical protein